MRKTILLAFAMSAAAFAGEFTGMISDSACGATNVAGGKANKTCIKSCVDSGSEPVLVTSDGKVINFANPEPAKKFLGEKVKVKGTMGKDKLTADSIAKAD